MLARNGAIREQADACEAPGWVCASDTAGSAAVGHPGTVANEQPESPSVALAAQVSGQAAAGTFSKGSPLVTRACRVIQSGRGPSSRKCTAGSGGLARPTLPAPRACAEFPCRLHRLHPLHRHLPDSGMAWVQGREAREAEGYMRLRHGGGGCREKRLSISSWCTCDRRCRCWSCLHAGDWYARCCAARCPAVFASLLPRHNRGVTCCPAPLPAAAAQL